MKIFRIAVFLGIVVGALYLIHYAEQNPGHVDIRWLDYEVTETSVPKLLIIFAGCLLAAFYAGQVWAWLAHVPVWLRRWRKEKKEQGGLKDLSQALEALAAGDAHKARKLSARVTKALPDKNLADYVSAMALDLNPEMPLKTPLLSYDDEPSFVALRARITQVMQAQAWQEAYALAEQARQMKPSSPWVLATLFELAEKTERAEEALKLVPALRKYNVLDPEEIDRCEVVWRLAQADVLVTQDKIAEALKVLVAGQKAQPDNVELVWRYAALLVQNNQKRKADNVLAAFWQRQPNAETFGRWLALYPDLPPKRLMAKANKVIMPRKHASHGYHAQALVYGRLNMWEKAKACLLKALDLAETEAQKPGIYQTLVEVEQMLNPQLGSQLPWLVKAAGVEILPTTKTPPALPPR